MKKTLLSLAAVLMTSGLSMAQFTFVPNTTAPTGLSFTGNTVPTAGTHGQFYQNQAYGSPNSYSDAGCTTVASGLGGFDANPDGSPNIHSTADGITYYGGSIATVYFDESWQSCAPHIPSVGFQTGTSGISDGYDIDLSDPANQRIKFTYTCDVAWTLELQLFDGAYNTKLNTLQVPISVGTHDVDIDFSSYLIGANSTVSTVRQVSLLYNSTTLSPNFGFSITNIQLGSAIVTGLTNSSAVASANLYPNPSNGQTTITANLNSVADVKVTLMDMYGKEVKVITQGTMSDINATFDVSDVAKGIYTVNYYVSGEPAKVQKLVVR